MPFLVEFANNLTRGHWTYYALFTTLILFFSYFWVSVMFKPIQIADDLKKYGGSIPRGRPPGPPPSFPDFLMNPLPPARPLLPPLIARLPGTPLHFLQAPP